MQIEAIDREDWERQDKGLPPLPKKKTVIQAQKEPDVDDQIKFDDIPLDRFEKLISARRRSIANEQGARFVGYDVKIELKGKRKAGRPKEDAEEPRSEILSGWMIEGNWLKLYRHIRDKIDLSRIAW